MDLNFSIISFFKINFSQYCACANTINYPNNTLPDSSCDMSCPGNPLFDLKCGASGIISIYNTLINVSTTTAMQATTTTTTTNTTTMPIVIVNSFTNMSSSQLNQILSNTPGSLTGCLLSCSNQGKCALNSLTNQMGCVCNQYFTGMSCEYDTRACISSPCLNGGNCTNVFTQNTTSFKCSCTNIYYGINCENQVDLCLNSTCAKGQGYCKVSGSTAKCVCLSGYVGVDCNEKSSALKTQSTIVSLASVLAFIIMGLFWFLVFFMDYLKYFIIKDKRVKETKKKFDWKRSNDKRRRINFKKPCSMGKKLNNSTTNYTSNDGNSAEGLKRFKELKEKCLDMSKVKVNDEDDLLKRFKNAKISNSRVF